MKVAIVGAGKLGIRPGVLWSMGHEKSDMTEWLNWTEAFFNEYVIKIYSNSKKKKERE